ncbi:hypothetical protein LAW41_24250, partial [Escherichia coli]|nr:hypothetical protein [Escherichia coli]
MPATTILSNNPVNSVFSNDNSHFTYRHIDFSIELLLSGFAPIFPDICYHLTHYKPAAADIPVASDNPAHYADAIRYNA